jgi:hypothetical protein
LPRASKIAPHSVGLLAERNVLSFQFFDGHLNLYFTSAAEEVFREQGEALMEQVTIRQWFRYGQAEASSKKEVRPPMFKRTSLMINVI